MSDGTHIEWTDASWTPFRAWGNKREALGWGCEKVSEGCQNCYAETINRRLGTGLPYSVKAVEKSGGRHYLDEAALLKPLSWKKPRRIFVSSMTDIFGDWVPFEWLDRVFAVMALTPQHTYQVLTKRPERMREYLTTKRHGMPTEGHVELAKDLLSTEQWGIGQFLGTWPLPNVWLGTSVELQRWADVRIPELLATPAVVRFLSCEPLLGPLDLRPWRLRLVCCGMDDGTVTRQTWSEADELRQSYLAVDGHERSAILDRSPDFGLQKRPDWVIVGGESGPKARPFDLAWARSIVTQCRAAGVAVFVKQLGAKPVNSWACNDDHGEHGKCDQRLRLKSRKGGDPGEWPADLRVREMPV